MDAPHAPAELPAPLRPAAPADTRLHGRWLVLARATWLLVAVLAVGLFVVSLPPYSARVVTLASPDAFLVAHDLASLRAGLEHLGLSLGVYAAYRIALSVAFALVFWLVAVLLFLRRSDEGMVLLVSLALVAFAASFPNTLLALSSANPMLDLPVRAVVALGWAFFLLFYLFPDGRFVPGWTRLLAVLFVVSVLLQVSWPGSPVDLATWPAPLQGAYFVGFLGSMAVAQVYRYRRVSGSVERQQTKWVVFGMVVAIAGWFATFLPAEVVPSLQEPGALAFYELVAPASLLLSFLLIPLSIAIAILKYRLWDIDLLINRALVYGTLTATLAAIYFGSVVLLQQLLRTLLGQGNDLTIIVSTLAIAALFNPLRHRIQDFIDRRFYRRKYDAAQVLAAFSAQMRDEVDLDQLADDVVAVAQETMQPTHVSLWLRKDVRKTGGAMRWEERQEP